MFKKYRIGAVAEITDVNITTIRYYESVGLLNEPERTKSGQRIYFQSDIDRLIFIRHARRLGFQIDDIRKIIHLQKKSHDDCWSVNDMVCRQISLVEDEIDHLKRLRHHLKVMKESCQGGQIKSCGVVKMLNDHSCQLRPCVK